MSRVIHRTDNIVIKASLKTTEKDGKKNSFFVFSTFLKNGRKYTVKLKNVCKEKIKDYVKIVDGGYYTLIKPLYNFDNATRYATIWIEDVESAETFKAEYTIVDD